MKNSKRSGKNSMRKKIISFIFFFSLALPSVMSAKDLSQDQINAIISLLQSFNVEAKVLENVKSSLGFIGVSTSASSSTTSSVSKSSNNNSSNNYSHIPVRDSIYPASNIGYDISYATSVYPVPPFGFAVIGVNKGKSFIGNPRLYSEFSWSHIASSRPTLYMNLNAPYGSTVAKHISSPKQCDGINAESTKVSSPLGEPNACEGYNYGYNSASFAFNYAKDNNASSNFWWLDIEEANSWSPDTSVNDAVIQGAIDFLNSQNIRVGIYSVPYMWRDIAGTTFVPSQSINGVSVSTPNWFAIGISTQIGAINACNTKAGFIKGSPVWIIQYVLDSISIDQNVAC